VFCGVGTEIPEPFPPEDLAPLFIFSKQKNRTRTTRWIFFITSPYILARFDQLKTIGYKIAKMVCK
jgi:hypothetical protein